MHCHRHFNPIKIKLNGYVLLVLKILTKEKNSNISSFNLSLNANDLNFIVYV